MAEKSAGRQTTPRTAWAAPRPTFGGPTMVEAVAGWIAPMATMLAAILTAANLGPRTTGSGFIVFTAGSIAWCVIALATDQTNLLWTNGFLVLVNLLGVWRWLGRAARFEQGGRAAEAASRAPETGAVTPASALIGARVTGRDGAALGKVVDALMRCDGLAVAYLVIRDGGVGGVGETLYGLDVAEVCLDDGALAADLDAGALARRIPLKADDWPAALSAPHRGLPAAAEPMRETGVRPGNAGPKHGR